MFLTWPLGGAKRSQVGLFTDHGVFKCTVKLHLQTSGASCDYVHDTWRLWKKSLRQHEHWFLCSQSSLSTGLCVLVLLLYYHYATLHLHKMLINHRSNPVTFALFKKKLQTLAFRKYNYLPLHISAALWAVYLTVFDYRLTFVLYFYFCQIELGWWGGTHGLCFLWCCYWNSAISKYE